MFDLNIVDHVRLNLTQTGENYTVHAGAAERLAKLTGRIRIGMLALLLAAAASSVASLIAGTGRAFQIAAVIAASLALAAYAAYVGWGFEGRVNAHRVCAHSLWRVCEGYRALLTEIQDGVLDRDAILRRRDELAAEAHQVYGMSFPLDQPAHESLRQSRHDEPHLERHDAHVDSLAASP